MRFSVLTAALGLFASSALSVKVTADGKPVDAPSGQCTPLDAPAHTVDIEPGQGPVSCNLYNGPNCQVALVGAISTSSPHAPLTEPASSVQCFGATKL